MEQQTPVTAAAAAAATATAAEQPSPPAAAGAAAPAAGPPDRRLASAPGWASGGLLALLIALAAAATRFPRLSTAPPGFLIDEAASALFAQSINRAHLPIFFGGGTPDVQEPFFFYVMKWTGTLFGWDVYGARAAAALCGVAVAVGCALWYRRALGWGWGLAGGLLVATSFWQLMFSRQAIRPISMPVFAAAGLWCLWEALACPPAARTLGLPRRLLWHAAAGAALGLGLYTYIAFRLVVPAALAIAALLLWNRRAGDRRVDPRGLALAGAVMLLVALPLGSYFARHPDDFWRRAAQVRDQEGGADVLRPGDPAAVARGYLVTLRGFVWDGYRAPNVNQPGRPILDPLLAAWAVAGFILALRHPLRPLHGLALLWFLIFILPSALSSPGHPVRELAATPAVFLFPLLAMRAAVAWSSDWDMSRRRAGGGDEPAPGRATTAGPAGGGDPSPDGGGDPSPAGRGAGRRSWRWPGPRGATIALVALSVAGSAAWSARDYFRVWAPSDAAYVAFQGDVRDSLAEIDRLPADGAPVYYSTWTLERLIAYLAPARPTRAIDGRVLLAMPATGNAYLVYPTVTAPPPGLLRYAAAPLGDPFATGRSPSGAIAWRVWQLGEAQRARLPYTIPTLAFPDGIELLGFEIAPVIPADASAPPPERTVAVTLVWRVPAAAAPRAARVRLLPDPASGDPARLGGPTSADVIVASSPPALLAPGGPDAREIVITRLTLPFPAGAGIADAQVALATDAAAPGDASFGEFAELNRIQYRATP